jgi:hypothetical protein
MLKWIPIKWIDFSYKNICYNSLLTLKWILTKWINFSHKNICYNLILKQWILIKLRMRLCVVYWMCVRSYVYVIWDFLLSGETNVLGWWCYEWLTTCNGLLAFRYLPLQHIYISSIWRYVAVLEAWWSNLMCCRYMQLSSAILQGLHTWICSRIQILFMSFVTGNV